MYYKKIPVNVNFTLKAKMTINDYFYNNQVSFGLMVRDDMYIDKKMPDVLGDYVAAAPLNLTYKDQAWNCFARKNSELMQGSVTGRELKPGDTVEVCIKSNPDGYAVKLGDGEFLTGGFDFKLTAVDPKHVYAGFFVSRNANRDGVKATVCKSSCEKIAFKRSTLIFSHVINYTDSGFYSI